jgi:aryl-alcohol dehydrogenase-like predicted oxidoreductase
VERVEVTGTGLGVARLCLGTMFFGTSVARDAAYEVLDAYREAGGDFLDTANSYAFWVDGGTGDESETLVGQWLADRGARDEVVLATKVGARPKPGGRSLADAEGLGARAVAEQVEGSLRRLGVDHVDVLYAHVRDAATPQEETLRAFDDVVRAGKVRAIAASNYTRDDLAAAVDISRENGLAEFRMVQQRFSYLLPDPAADLGRQRLLDEELRVYCADQQIVPLAYSVLLSGAYTRADRPLPPAYQNAHRAQEHIDAVHAVGRDLGVSPNTVVYAWLLAAGTVPLMGVSNVEQLREGLAADALALPARSLALLETVRNG